MSTKEVCLFFAKISISRETKIRKILFPMISAHHCQKVSDHTLTFNTFLLKSLTFP